MSKLGILIPGISGTLASTVAAGVWITKNCSDESLKNGMLTEHPPASCLSLTSVKDIIVGGWDINNSTPYETCIKENVLSSRNLLRLIKKMPPLDVYEAVVLPTDYASMREGFSVAECSHEKCIEKIREDIINFRDNNDLTDVVVVNLTSPPCNLTLSAWHNDYDDFLKHLSANDNNITSQMLYCIAAIREGCPYIDFTPSPSLSSKALEHEAIVNKIPIAGRDGSTGQTLLKSVIAHTLEIRKLPIESWYSTNLLGNHDGLVLSDNDFSESKIHDKMDVLSFLENPDIEHIVDIRYLQNKGDCKEAWDSVEIKGWLGEQISLKINWLGRDSVLASPLVIDLARLLNFCKQRNLTGIQPQFGVYFKQPLGITEKRFFNLYQIFIEFCNEYKETEE